VNVEEVKQTQDELLQFFIQRHSGILTEIRDKQKIDEELENKIKNAISEFTNGR
jgi:F0F1-type ATP synthase alpha subunit